MAVDQGDVVIADKVLVLLSGGIDSSVLAAKLHQEGIDVHALTIYFSNGSASNVEVEHACHQAERLGIQHTVLNLSAVGMVAPNRWMCLGGKNPDGNYCPTRQYPSLPGSVQMMHVAAMMYAMSHSITQICWALHRDDLQGEPEGQTNDYLRQLEQLFPNSGVRFILPFETVSKREVIALGKDLGVDIDDTRSCSEPEGEPCGKCAQCFLRAEAMAEEAAEVLFPA